MDLAKEWGTEHFTVYKATCSRNGNYQCRRWNDEILEIYHRDLFAAFDKVIEAVKATKSSVPRNIIKIVRGIAENLKRTSFVFVSFEIHLY